MYLQPFFINSHQFTKANFQCKSSRKEHGSDTTWHRNVTVKLFTLIPPYVDNSTFQTLLKCCSLHSTWSYYLSPLFYSVWLPSLDFRSSCSMLLHDSSNCLTWPSSLEFLLSACSTHTCLDPISTSSWPYFPGRQIFLNHSFSLAPTTSSWWDHFIIGSAPSLGFPPTSLLNSLGFSLTNCFNLGQWLIKKNGHYLSLFQLLCEALYFVDFTDFLTQFYLPQCSLFFTLPLHSFCLTAQFSLSWIS